MIEIEQWKDIKGYEGLYQVSNNGNIKSLARTMSSGRKLNPIIMKMQEDKRGYLSVLLSKDGSKKRVRIHREVAKAFVENPFNKEQVNHIDEDKTNNKANNLEWMTLLENINHGTGIQRKAKALNRPIIAINELTGETIHFNSIKEAGEKGFNRGNIDSCIKGKLKHHKGYTWKYKQDTNPL